MLPLVPIFLVLSFGCVVRSEDEGKMTIFRLPNDTEPVSYTIRLIPLLNVTLNTENEVPDPSYFKGEVDIRIKVTEPGTSEIALHAYKLNISSVAVKKTNGIPVEVLNYHLCEDNQILFINTTTDLIYNREYIVSINYTGVHNNDMKGFYQSIYVLNDQMKILAVTQFESTFARQAFPCYDEPKYRTPFQIYIAREEGQIALSNMPLVNSTKDDTISRTWDLFKTTEPMATYLVAFSVSSFSYLSADLSGIVWDFNVWSRENAVDQGQYIVQEGPKLLAKLEELTEIGYKLPKMDVVAVPDFAAGAMENWGMTTYRESRVLTSNLSTTRQRRIVTQVVAHEFAHQWFGDLVTPVWWSCVWLNEAFATYYEYLIPALVEPSWRMKDMFVVEEVQTALAADGYMVHRPMTYYVSSPSKISEQFDVIIYNKGGAVLRMLQHMVSKVTFNNAITEYLQDGDSSGGSVTPENLWDAFEEQVTIQQQQQALPPDVSITDIMKTWTEQPGYPLVTITRNYTNNTVLISQEVYRNSRSTKKLDNYIWHVPISCTNKSSLAFNETRPKFWLTNSTKEETLQLDNTEWIICNLKQTGYYRVNYDKKNWDLITDQLLTDHKSIDVLNRAQIINDAFNLAMDDVIDFQIPFKLANYLHNETDIVPWMAAINVFYSLRDIYQDTEIQHLLEVRFSSLITEQYNRLTLKTNDSDDDTTKIGRQLFSTAACSFNVPSCISEAQAVMSDFIDSDGKLSVSPDILPAVFCVGIRYEEKSEANNAVFNYFLNNANDASVLEIVFPAFACSQNETRLERFLELQFLDKLPFRRQDHRYILLAIQKYRGANAAFTVIKKYLPDIKNADKSTVKILESMMETLGKYASTDSHVDSINEIITSDQFNDAPKSFQDSTKKAQERIKVRNEWRKKHEETLIADLSEDVHTDTPTEQPTTAVPTVSPPITPPPSSASASTISIILLSLTAMLVSCPVVLS